MTAKLKKDWLLRGWVDAPMTVAHRIKGNVIRLNEKWFYTIESCDGQTDFNSLAFLPEHRAILDEFIREGIVETCQEGDSIEPFQQYRKTDNPCLIAIDWCVTGKCNLNCRHCYMESPSGRYGELPFTDMARLIDQFERANVLQVSLTGGEPFLRRDILDIVARLAEKNIWLSQIYSNGLLITRDHLEGIKRIGFLPSIQISFDGVGAHDQMRGTKGSEQGAIEGIKLARAAGFPVVVATCIDRLNVSRLGDTYELMKRLGVLSWRIAAPQKTGNWRGTTTALSLNDTADACAQLLDRWIKNGKPLSIQLAGLYSGVPGSVSSAEEKQMPNYTPDTFVCGACREQPNLLPDGTLVPCPGYVDTVVQGRMPNLLCTDLAEAWTNSSLRDIVDMKKKDLLAKNPECAVCGLFKECGIGCRTSALAETGDLMAKDPTACDLWKGGYKKRFEELAMAATNK